MRLPRRPAGIVAALSVAVFASGAHAQTPVRAAAEAGEASPAAREASPTTRDPAPVYRARARVRASSPEGQGRATGEVTREEMDERVVRSAPDAVRWVAGVSVQQTTHGQGSPYVRGVTGQQVVLAFDGVRLNNGTFRQGPNQYFFTIDAATLERLDVVRGSASTRWGSDAVGGAILASPREPTLDPEERGLRLRPRAVGRFGSADLDTGGRLEVDAQVGRDVALLIGGGYRAAQPLQGGGVVVNPADGEPARSPLIEADGRTQHGTGFRYGNYDGRLSWRVAPAMRVVAALYGFQQYDTPRADRCPPPYASRTECLTFAEQFHHLAYLSLRGAPSPDLREFDVTVSYQRQHELRQSARPASFVRTDATDDVDTVGLAARIGSRPFTLAPSVAMSVRGGADAYLDHVDSASDVTFTDLDLRLAQSRGQYADGARHYTGGVWGELHAELAGRVRLRGGLRAAFAGARASAEPRSGSPAVHGDWGAPVANVGLEVPVGAEVSLAANVDQGFRAPNLDDLTSRQVIGPGYQFENASLRPERSTTYEVGARVQTDVLRLEGWAYATQIESAITRAPRPVEDCPAMTPACAGSWTRFQLVNVEGESWILGGELAALVSTPWGLRARATVAMAWGEGPNPAPPPQGTSVGYDARVPLSRIPPLQGNVELRYTHPDTALSFGLAARWAAGQDRLAPADLGDARIPIGGSSPYAVFDLRAGYRFERLLRADVVFENVFDQAYRVHGSGINGAGRGLLVQVEAAY